MSSEASEEGEEGGERCLNFLVCQHTSAPTCGPLCMTCGSWLKLDGFGWDQLDIALDSPEPCPVCLGEHLPSVRLPQCTHRLCPDCFRCIMFWDETRHHLDPRPYGCPPCPNACDNPVRGSQCYCDEYDTIQDAWKVSHPNEYQLWNESEHLSIEIPIEGSYASKQCPICREEYHRNLHGAGM